MRVLVTGDTGYIGSVMVPMLVEQGFNVVGVDADLFVDCLFEEAQLRAPHIRANILDLTVDDLRGFDAVFHLAALSNDPLGDLNPNATYEINHAGSVRLAMVAKEAGVERFIFSSSCSLYGGSGQGPVTEEAAFAPITPYARSKAMVEWSLSALADTNFSPVFLRNATAYGVSPRMRFDLVLNNLTAWAVARGSVLIKSDGTPWRPVVHITDITRAFIAAALAPRENIHNEAFNIGQAEDNYQICDLANMVEDVVPGCRIDYAPGGEPDRRSYRVSFEKARRQLPGFEPQWNARRGVEQLYAAFRRVGVSVEDFEGPRFRRIGTLRRLIDEGRLPASLHGVRLDTPVAARLTAAL